MALTQATLASALEALEPTVDEVSAIAAIVDAWDAYFAESTVSGAAAVPVGYAPGLTAMAGAMVGLSASGAAAAKITAGISAFWAAIAALPVSIWITAPIVLVPPIAPPPGLGALGTNLLFAFNATQTAGGDLATAANNMAIAIHSSNAGALVNGSVPPAPPAPLPIL